MKARSTLGMNRLFVSLVLIGVAGLGIDSARADTISFLEDPLDIAPITVSTDISGAVTTSLESATLDVGNVTGPFIRLIIAKALIQPGSMEEGGGQGVSDVLELFDFFSDDSFDTTVGFKALFKSDNENGIGAEDLTPPDIVETGSPQVVFSGTVTLPGTPGLTSLTVNVQSDRDGAVPEPSMLGLVSVSLLGFGIMRRRRTTS